eukprot:671053-Hanusia_phi.AAC.1
MNPGRGVTVWTVHRRRLKLSDSAETVEPSAARAASARTGNLPSWHCAASSAPGDPILASDPSESESDESESGRTQRPSTPRRNRRSKVRRASHTESGRAAGAAVPGLGSY